METILNLLKSSIRSVPINLGAIIEWKPTPSYLTAIPVLGVPINLGAIIEWKRHSHIR